MTKEIIVKFLKQKTSWIPILLAIIPACLMVGIFGQVMVLSQYNSIILFSWSQVVNDTILLILPIISGGLGAMLYRLLSEQKHGWLYSFGRFIFIFLAGGLVVPLVEMVTGINIYMRLIFISYFLGVLIFIICSTISKMNPKEVAPNSVGYKALDFIMPTLGAVIIILVFMVVFGISNALYGGFYKHMRVEIKDSTTLSGAVVRESIMYMNDKYIIYGSGDILPNNGTYKIVSAKNY